jgi:hypothetical protein
MKNKPLFASKKVFLASSLIILGFCLATFIHDAVQNSKVPIAKSKSKERLHARENEILWKLNHGRSIDVSDFSDIKTFVDNRYDTADFRLQSILRILYDYESELTPAMFDSIKQMLLNFKYWMDEPGDDGMCYWSENHQILFAAAEYLAGQRFKNDIFPNSGLTGLEHEQKSRQRLLTWLEQRWKFGFVEWYSNVYYVEDIAPLANLIDFAKDPEIVAKCKIVMDLMLYDLASQSYRGTFVSSMGRSYEGGKKSGERASTRAITEKVFDFNADQGERRGMDLNFLYIKNYTVPPVLRDIGRDTSTVVIIASNGLDLSELNKHDLIGIKDNQIMMQWAMEAFTNHQIIDNSVNYINRRNMRSNEFLYDFRLINFRLLRWLNLLPTASRLLNPKFNGSVIQRANVYTYRTPNYSMYTAQNYHPGDFGDQHHVFGVTLSNELSVFHNHPALPAGEKPVSGNSPTYWVGYGRLPHSVQHENVNLSIYSLPSKKGLFENDVLDFTQFYCPREMFDEFILKGSKLYLRHRKTFLAVIGNHNFDYDQQQKAVIQKGRRSFFICEASSEENETFEHFVQRVHSNTVLFDGNTLQYRSNGKSYDLQFGGDFNIDGKRVDTSYPRFNSPYVHAEREPEEIRFQFNGKSLLLNFDSATRIIGNSAY